MAFMHAVHKYLSSHMHDRVHHALHEHKFAVTEYLYRTCARDQKMSEWIHRMFAANA